MGTRSTVKFYSDGDNILSVYQQYDGYPSGVGKQVADLLKKYEIVNGLPIEDDSSIANGIMELALYYIIDNKKSSGNIYATTVNNYEEYNYEIYAEHINMVDVITSVKICDSDGNYDFDGTLDEFLIYVKNHGG